MLCAYPGNTPTVIEYCPAVLAGPELNIEMSLPVISQWVVKCRARGLAPCLKRALHLALCVSVCGNFFVLIFENAAWSYVRFHPSSSYITAFMSLHSYFCVLHYNYYDSAITLALLPRELATVCCHATLGSHSVIVLSSSFRTILCTKICMAAQGDMREFNDLLLAEFSSNSSTDLEALVEPFVSELFFSGDIPCSSPQFISTARRIAQALVSEDTSLSTAQLLPDSLCSNTIAGEASAVVYATEGGYQDPREGMSASEFSTLNPATGSVVIRDGTISPENFITDFVLVSKPLLLKGLAREQKAFLRWQDQYLVNVLTSSGRHASLKDKEDVMFELLYGEEALLNGLISEELAGQ